MRSCGCHMSDLDHQPRSGVCSFREPFVAYAVMTAVRQIVQDRDRDQEPGPRIGLALGSGSARGWAHIGVIEALAEEGVRPDVVCGTSIGALVGAAYATGRLERLEAWARRISWLEVTRLMDLKMAGGGLVEGHRMMRFLRKLQGDPQIQTLDTAFAAVAADLVTGHEIWLREGSMIDAVRASMALPGIFSPVQRGGHRLVDGGLVNPVPVAPCRAPGAEFIIAVNLNGELVGRRVERKAKSRAGSRVKSAAKSPGGSRKTRALRTEILERLSRELPSALGGGTKLLAGQLIGVLLQHALHCQHCCNRTPEQCGTHRTASDSVE